MLGAAALFATAGLVGLAGGRLAVVAVGCALSVAASLYAISIGSQRMEPLTAVSGLPADSKLPRGRLIDKRRPSSASSTRSFRPPQPPTQLTVLAQ